MQYCDDCEDLLLPMKKNSDTLICRTCGKTYMRSEKQYPLKDDYKISHKKKTTIKSKNYFAIKNKRTITEEDRRAFEDLTYDD